MSQTWLFQCNPDRFDIDGFLASQPAETNWLVRQHPKQIAPGDQVFIWRAIGSGSRQVSGIVAEAEVLTHTAELPEIPLSGHTGTIQTKRMSLNPA
jgi:hypothetical protein